MEMMFMLFYLFVMAFFLTAGVAVAITLVEYAANRLKSYVYDTKCDQDCRQGRDCNCK